MFGTYNNPGLRSFSAFNPAMQPHHSAMGMTPYSSWHMNQNYHTPQPMSYYPPTSAMSYQNAFHGSPFDYQPNPYGGHPYMHSQPMMDPYYEDMYKEPSMFDSCCPPRNPYDDHMLPPYQSQRSVRQPKPDQHQHRQESVNNQSQSQSQSQTQQNRSSSQSLTRQETQQHQRY